MDIPNRLVFKYVTEHSPLLDKEQLQVSGFSEGRKTQYALGRSAAKKCLEELNITNFPVLKATGGNPIWPKNILGSIAHTDGAGVSVAGRSEDFIGVGVDIERIEREFKIDISRKICGEKERNDIGPDRKKLLRIFSAKECIFKAFYPLAETRLLFKDAEIELNDDGGFSAKLLRSPAPNVNEGQKLSGLSFIRDEYLISILAYPKE